MDIYSSVVHLANTALVLAIISRYRQVDERFGDFIYGWIAGLVTLIAIALTHLINSPTLHRLNDISILAFWVAAMALISASSADPRPQAATTPASAFTVLGMILGLSPANYSLVKLITSSRLPPASGGIMGSLFVFAFLIIWFALSVGKRFFAGPAVLLGLAVVNLPFVFNKIAGFVSILVHEIFHLYAVLFLLPDHPWTRLWWYKTVNFVLKPTFSTSAALAILAAPALIIMTRRLKDYRQEDPRFGAAWRKSKAEKRSSLRWQAFFSAVLVLTMTGNAAAGLNPGAANGLPPRPAIIDKGSALVAESNPFNKIKNGELNKFYVDWLDRRSTFLVIKQAGRYTAALDACPICGDTDGYSQAKSGDLICNFCSTVMPISSFGEAGGCNPIPLSVHQEPGGLSIKLSEIKKQLENVSRGRGKK